jgi:hypothetical protein
MRQISAKTLLRQLTRHDKELGIIGLTVLYGLVYSAARHLTSPAAERFFHPEQQTPQRRQAEPRITLQKFMRSKFGSLSASTSDFTLPNVVSGLCLMPS